MKTPRYLSYNESVKFLTCPKCFKPNGSTLQYGGGYFICTKCKQKYPIKNKIIELVNPKLLSKQVRNELKGNVIPLTSKNIKRFATKDKWSNYYNHFVSQKIDYLVQGLEKIKAEGIISLGSGPGFELKQILKRKHYPLVFSSDLAITTTKIVPHSLKGFDITLCLFTSDLNFIPVLPKKTLPILIYEALHHTKNSTKTIEKMMKKKYENIFFVEPCTNFLIKFLAKLGLAQREEYSGLIPDFIDLEKLKKTVGRYGYHANIKTIWDIPEEYIRLICKKGSGIESALLKAIDLASAIGNLFNFGSFAIVHLHNEKGS